MKLGGKHINKKSNTSGENENENDIGKGTKMSKILHKRKMLL